MTTEPTAPDEHAEPVIVATFGHPGEAEVARMTLGAYGIDAFIVDEVEGGAVPVEGEAGVTLQVRAQDADEAQRILAAADEPS
jgi:hypothetical protein